MPMAPMSNDTPSPGLKTADTLNRGPGIPMSATSDMPVITPAGADKTPVEEAPIDKPDADADASATSDSKPEGEADGKPNEVPGEEKDKTSPQQRAAFARERNKRLAAEQARVALEAKIDKLAETVAKLVDAGKPEEDARPVRASFEDPDAYDKALEAWASNRAAKVAQAEAQAELAKAERERDLKIAQDTFNQRVDAFKKDHEDFEDLVYDDTLFTNPTLGQAILEAEDGPAIAYYLAQNPEEHDRINALRPARVVLEVGKLSARLEAPVVPAPKPKADPIVPLRARNPAGPKDPANMTMDEYSEYRKSKQH
jgi:hypothetical protein